MTLSRARINLSLLRKFSTIAKRTGTLFEPFSPHTLGIPASLMTLPLLLLSSLTGFNLAWIYSFPLPSNLARNIPQSGSIHSVQKLSRIRTIASNNGNSIKLHIPEFNLYKLVTFAPKPSIRPKPLLSPVSTIRLLPVRLDFLVLSHSCLLFLF